MGTTNLGQVAAFVQSVSVEAIPEGQTPTVRNDGTKANAELVFRLPVNSGAAAQAAAQSASEAASDALKSEGYAVGKQDGTAVSSGEYFENNAKYYKEQAQSSAQAASQSETDSEANALKAEGYAVGKQNGTDVSSGDYYQDNAKWYKEQAAQSASNAAGSASDSEDWATVARNAAAGVTGNGFGTCATEAGTAAKTVTIAEFQLYAGVKIQVLFTNGHTLAATKTDGVVTANYPTLNVNDTGAKPIKVGAEYAGENFVTAGDAHEFVYDGACWRDLTAINIYSNSDCAKQRNGSIDGWLTMQATICSGFETVIGNILKYNPARKQVYLERLSVRPTDQDWNQHLFQTFIKFPKNGFRVDSWWMNCVGIVYTPAGSFLPVGLTVTNEDNDYFGLQLAQLLDSTNSEVRTLGGVLQFY